MAGNYIGVPAQGYTPGQLVQTGFAGVSNVNDYGGQPVYAPDGTRLPDGAVIPAGAYVSIGSPPPAGSYDPTTGSVVLPGGQKVPPTGTAQSVQTGVDITKTNADIARDAVYADVADRAQKAQEAQFQKTYDQTEAQNKRQYDLDVLTYGQNEAIRLFNERQAQAQLDLNTKIFESQRDYNNARLGLDTRAQGETERQNAFGRADTVAGRQLDVLGMLSGLSGPQDWVKYTNLLNGLSAPNPEATQQIDVMSLLQPLQQQAGAAGAPVPNSGQPAAVQPAPQGGATGTAVPYPGPGGVGRPAPTQTPVQPRPIPAAPPGQQPGYGGGTAFGGQIEMPPPPRGMGQPAVVTGDAPGRRTGVEEMVVGSPGSQISVIPMGKRRLPPGVPRAAQGGVYDAGIGTGQIDINRYNPATLGSQPFIQKLTGQRQSRPYGSFGAQISNPRLGISNAPWALNAKTLAELYPSEYDQATDLYNTGFGVDFRDVVAQSQRAAPYGAAMNAASYGR